MAKQEKTAAELYREERKARLAKAAKKNQKKSMTAGSAQKADKIFAVVVVIALVVGIGAFVANHLGLAEQMRTAFKVGDEKISQAEYNYYYSNMYSRIYQYVNYGYDVGYDSSKTPDAQEYNGSMGEIKDFPEDQTPTWADYLEYSAKQNVSVMKAALKVADELGIKLDDADYKGIDDEINEMKETADNNNYSLGAYLKASCGKGVSKAMFKKILEEQAIYQKVIDNKTEEIKPTLKVQDVEKEFEAEKQQFGVVSYRVYTITPEAIEVKDEETGETTNQTTDKTKAAAKADADKLAKAKNEDEFVAIVEELEAAKGTKKFDASSTYTADADINTLYYAVTDEEAATWAFNKSTKVNDIKVVEKEDESIVVLMVVEPAHKAPDKLTYDVRHILVKFPEANEEEKTDAKEEAAKVETLDVSAYKDVTIDLNVDADSAKDADTYKKAQDILVEYLTGDKTSESFAALAEKYSEDVDQEGKLNSNGLYENVEKGQMVPQFEKWALEDGRKEGDVGIVETTYGYHIMYFVGSKITKWDDPVRTHLAEEKVSEYQEELVADESVAITAINEKALDKVEASIIKLAKNQIANAANQSSYGY